MPRYRRKRPSEREHFSIPLQKPSGPKPGPEVLPWYWNPNRESSVKAPAEFSRKLHAIDPDLETVFSPVHERWLIWVKNPRITHWLCRGWQLLYLWEDPRTHEFLPLNELVFHNLMLIDSSKYANAQAYYDRVQARIEEAKEERDKAYTAERRTRQEEMRQSHQISNLGTGSKAALHHDGSIVPSQGQQAWLDQTRKWRLPSELLKREQDEKEQRQYGR